MKYAKIRRSLAMALIAAMLLCFTGCGTDPGQTSEPTEKPSESVQETQANAASFAGQDDYQVIIDEMIYYLGAPDWAQDHRKIFGMMSREVFDFCANMQNTDPEAAWEVLGSRYEFRKQQREEAIKNGEAVEEWPDKDFRIDGKIEYTKENFREQFRKDFPELYDALVKIGYFSVGLDHFDRLIWITLTESFYITDTGERHEEDRSFAVREENGKWYLDVMTPLNLNEMKY